MLPFNLFDSTVILSIHWVRTLWNNENTNDIFWVFSTDEKLHQRHDIVIKNIKKFNWQHWQICLSEKQHFSVEFVIINSLVRSRRYTAETDPMNEKQKPFTNWKQKAYLLSTSVRLVLLCLLYSCIMIWIIHISKFYRFSRLQNIVGLVSCTKIKTVIRYQLK